MSNGQAGVNDIADLLSTKHGAWLSDGVSRDFSRLKYLMIT